jgi:hypothetical protein
MISMVLILYEMVKWFRARTISLEPWFDPPRIQPPPEEVDALTDLVRSSYLNTMVYSELKQRVNDDITDAVALILGLDEDQLRKLALDDQFVNETFGPYANLVRHLSKGNVTEIPATAAGKKNLKMESEMEVFLRDINLLLDQVKRWEKHEGQGSLRTR